MMFLRNALTVSFGFLVMVSTAVSQTATRVVVAGAPATQSGTSTGAQISATGGTRVHGTITDPDGALIPGATVTFTPAHGSAVKATTGSDGTYKVSVSAGSYTLLVTMPGFSAYSVVNLKVPAVASTTIDAKLKVGEQTQVVNVDANAITLSVDPENNADATILTGKDLDALSDDPDELSSELTALAGPSAGPNGGQIYVDGFTGGQLPPKSSIREIRINSNPFSAQYDKLGYGRVEVFTKPGTDKLHGNLQTNYNPSQFNDGNPLTNTYQPPYHTLFLFGNLTGPVNKNASYNLGGSFRQIQDDEFTNAVLLAPGVTTTTACTQTTGGVVTINPACEQPYQTSTYYPQRRVDINPRLDLALGAKNVLVTRYQYVNNTSQSGGIGNLTLPSAGDNYSSLSNELQISDTQTWSAKLINETRFEYEREHTQTTPLSGAPNVNVSGSFVNGGSASQYASDHQDHFEFQNYTSIQLKKNFVRLGGRLRSTREALNTGADTNGGFTYNTLIYSCSTTIPGTTTPCTTPTSGIGTSADHSYLTGTPSQASYTLVNNHDIGDTFTDLGIYAESDWKVKPNMTVSYGGRYETQNHLSDHHDFAPRVSVSYGLFGVKGGAPKTVVHGGFGMFYDRFGQGNILTLEEQNGANETAYTVQNPSATCTPGAIGSTLTFAAFKANCLPLGATSNLQQQYQAALNLRTPYTTQFALGVDQQLSRFGTLSVNYIHSEGVHQLATQNLNYNVATQAVANPTVGPQYQYFTEGVFNQNQLVVNGRVQTTKWLSFFGYYTVQSAHGDTSGAGAFITTPGNIAADYGRTTFDVKSRVFMAGSATLPHYIQISPFAIGFTGNPYNITTGSDVNGDNIYNDRPYLVTGVAANGTTIKTIPGCGTFAQPGSQPAGSSIVPINYCTGPGLFTFNVRVTKTIGFGASKNAAAASGGGPGGPGGPPGGGGHGGGGNRGGGPGGPGGGGFAAGASTGKRYNVNFGVQVMNLFANKDLATPQGALSSPNFGTSTQLSGGPYTTDNALRRVMAQASFTF